MYGVPPDNAAATTTSMKGDKNFGTVERISAPQLYSLIQSMQTLASRFTVLQGATEQVWQIE